MTRVLLVSLLSLSWAPLAVADDLRVSNVERDVLELQREVRALRSEVTELRARAARSSDRSPLPASPAAMAGGDAWIDASKWNRLRVGMSELEVIDTLGPPTSMRVENGGRVLLYALEVGSGFLSGSVIFRDRVVTEVRKPALR